MVGAGDAARATRSISRAASSAARSAKRIAQSLKRSAEHSKRRKAGPFQSAMSMLDLYINRGGRNLPATQKRVLTRAKDELRRLFGRE